MNILKKNSIVILRNEDPSDHLLWIEACKKFYENVEYRLVNLTSFNWLENLQKQPFDVLLAKPGGLTSTYKQLYDERIFIISHILGYRVFPSPLEIFIYENKRFLSFWLKANDIPHPFTSVFYNKKAAIQYSIETKYPFVAKTNIGASGSGVTILKDPKEAREYLALAFSNKGTPRRTGPNLSRGGYLKRGFHYIRHPNNIIKKWNIYRTRRMDPQRGFVIFQEYIPHEYEWRVVRIGDSFFAHKKLRQGKKASGSLLKSYENPPLALLDFVKGITDKYRFYSQAVDIFEYERGYLVNEMQCFFGQSDPYQMLVGGKPGRYRHLGGQWVFEEGDYARNACFDLRLEYVLSMFEKEK